MSRKTYFRMPSFNYPPDGLIRLGQIITSATEPYTPLSEPLTPIPGIQQDVKTDCGEVISQAQSGKIGLWTQFLASFAGVGVDVAANWACGNSNVMQFGQLETVFFEPDDEYLSSCVESSAKIQEYLSKHPTRSLYMITGLKIARSATCVSMARGSVGGEAQLGVDATPFTGAPFQVGPGITVENSQVHGQWFGGSSDFVFAYRLRRIIVTFNGIIKGRTFERRAEVLAHNNEEIHDGGLDEDAKAKLDPRGLSDEEPNEIASIYLDKSDYGEKGVPFGINSMVVRDESDNTTCTFIVPSTQ